VSCSRIQWQARHLQTSGVLGVAVNSREARVPLLGTGMALFPLECNIAGKKHIISKNKEIKK